MRRKLLTPLSPYLKSDRRSKTFTYLLSTALLWASLQRSERTRELWPISDKASSRSLRIEFKVFPNSAK
jgi:hypothetical protein